MHKTKDQANEVASDFALTACLLVNFKSLG